MRQRPSRYAIRAGRNFVSFPCSQGDRLCLHLKKALDDRLRHIPSLTAWVHGAGQPHDLTESGCASVFTPSHSFANVCEQFEVPMLAGPQRIAPEVRNDSRQKQGETADLPLQGFDRSGRAEWCRTRSSAGSPAVLGYDRRSDSPRCLAWPPIQRRALDAERPTP